MSKPCVKNVLRACLVFDRTHLVEASIPRTLPDRRPRSGVQHLPFTTPPVDDGRPLGADPDTGPAAPSSPFRRTPVIDPRNEILHPVRDSPRLFPLAAGGKLIHTSAVYRY